MPRKKNPPCLRNIDRFRRSGCPQKTWDGTEGCQAWVERTFPGEPGKNPTIVRLCMDIWSLDYQLEMLKLLEGNQQATESFRNGMCEEVAGQVVPKMDRAVLRLAGILQRQKEDLALLKTQQPLEIAE